MSGKIRYSESGVPIADPPPRKGKSESILSVCSIIIAMCALIISAYNSYATREHYRVSIAPKIDIDAEYSRENALVIWIRNPGLGPAIISNFEIRFNGNKIAGEDVSDLSNIIKEMDLKSDQIDYNPLQKDKMIRKDQEIRLFAINRKYTEEFCSNSPCWEKLREMLKKLQIEIQYESLYNVVFTSKRDGFRAPE